MTAIGLGQTSVAKTLTFAATLALGVVHTVCLGGLLIAHVKTEVVVIASALVVRITCPYCREEQCDDEKRGNRSHCVRHHLNVLPHTGVAEKRRCRAFEAHFNVIRERATLLKAATETSSHAR